jgi:hypothetical protein
MGFITIYMGIYGGGAGGVTPPSSGAGTDFVGVSLNTGAGASSGFVGVGTV